MDRGAVQWQMGSSLKFSSDVCIECWCHDHRIMGSAARRLCRARAPSAHADAGGDKDRRLFYIWIHVGMVPEREGLQKQYAQQFTRAELDKVDKSAGVGLLLPPFLFSTKFPCDSLAPIPPPHSCLAISWLN